MSDFLICVTQQINNYIFRTSDCDSDEWFPLSWNRGREKPWSEWSCALGPSIHTLQAGHAFLPAALALSCIIGFIADTSGQSRWVQGLLSLGQYARYTLHSRQVNGKAYSIPGSYFPHALWNQQERWMTQTRDCSVNAEEAASPTTGLYERSLTMLSSTSSFGESTIML